MSGGTEVFITGDNFSNITDPRNVKCKFTLFESSASSTANRGPV